jgi:hypothetical protein
LYCGETRDPIVTAQVMRGGTDALSPPLELTTLWQIGPPFIVTTVFSHKKDLIQANPPGQ